MGLLQVHQLQSLHQSRRLLELTSGTRTLTLRDVGLTKTATLMKALKLMNLEKESCSITRKRSQQPKRPPRKKKQQTMTNSGGRKVKQVKEQDSGLLLLLLLVLLL